MVKDGRASGYTLIELVLTLVLIGILAVAAIGFFATKDSYIARTVADQFLSQARLAQQVALARAADSGSPVDLSVTRSGDNITLQVTTGGATATRTVDAHGVVIRRKTSSTTACGSVSDHDFTIQFNGRGNVTPAVNNLICIFGNQTIAVCISPLGYAYEAACES